MSNQNRLYRDVLSHHHARGTLEVFVIQLQWRCSIYLQCPQLLKEH